MPIMPKIMLVLGSIISAGLLFINFQNNIHKTFALVKELTSFIIAKSSFYVKQHISFKKRKCDRAWENRSYRNFFKIPFLPEKDCS